MTDFFDDYDYTDHDAYGTPDSPMLKKIREAGFKPIGITTMICEETFIFKGIAEAKAAWEIFKNYGWWYGFDDFISSWEDYVKKLYGGDEDQAPMVYWLDDNFKPKY